MADILLTRHLSIFDPAPHKKIPVHIIGVGATGSRVFMALVELGVTNIHVHDFDIVEAHNLANQIYNASDVGKLKVDACKDAYKLKTGQEPPASMTFNSGAVPNDNVKIEGIVFLLTDTMASRREIYNSCLKKNEDIFCVIETRMASSYGNILVFEPFIGKQGDKWEATLTDDAVAEVSACGTSISVGVTASIIANMAVWQFIHYLTDAAAVDTYSNIYLKPFVLGQGASLK